MKHQFLAIKLEDVFFKKKLMGMARIQEYGHFMHMGSDLTEHTFE